MDIDKELPKKFKANHAGRRSECFGYIWTGLLLVAISLGIAATFAGPLFEALTPLLPVLFIAVPALLVCLNWQHHTNIMHQSWCEFTPEGVEFHNHKGRKYFRWADVTKVHIGKNAAMDLESSRKYKFYTVEIGSGGEKFVITSEYFSEEDHMEIRRITKLKAPPTAQRTRYDD